MIKKIKLLFFPFFILILILISYFAFKFWQNHYKSPIGSNLQFSNIDSWFRPKNNDDDMLVYGFLPYWNINKVTIQPELTHLSYFALAVAADGQIITENKPGETEPGYLKLNSDELFSLINNEKIKSELVLSQFDEKIIDQFLSNQQAWLTFLEQIDSLLLAYPFTGINLDFEYQGEVSESKRQQFVNFVISVRQHLINYPEKINLSIDVYASAGDPEKKLLWDLVKLEPYLDYVIVMAYDFHRQGSTQAGPGAPLLGGQDLWNSDINSLMRGFFEQIKREKILLGVPFYGYGWQTDSLEPRANTYPGTGFTVSYQEALNLQNLTGRWENCTNLAITWHEEALSPFATLTCAKQNQDDQEIVAEENDNRKNNDQEAMINYLVYFENERSLQYKIDFAKQLDLAGIAIWALGYEGESRDLWKVIKELN